MVPIPEGLSPSWQVGCGSRSRKLRAHISSAHGKQGEKERERENRKWARFQTLKAGIQHFSSSKAAPSKGSRTLPNSKAN